MNLRKIRIYNRILAVIVGFAIFGIMFSARNLLIPYYYGIFGADRLLPHAEFRRTLASRLLKAAENVKWGRHALAIFQIEAAAAVLDNRYHRSNSLHPLAQPGWGSASSLSQEPYGSPMNPNLTYHLGRSFTLLPNVDVESLPQNDSVYNDLGSYVTILIDDCRDSLIESRKVKIRRMIAQIHTHWPHVKIIIGVKRLSLSELDEVQNGNDVIATEVECDKWNRAPVEPFLSYVKSPYVLFLESTAAVTSDLSITRLLRVSAGMAGVGVVGIAERGIDGGWDYTCSQLHHRNAHLTILDGYEYSQGACLFCDVTSSSFLAATNVLQTVQPDSTLPVEARKIDWALRLHSIDVITVTCPDVMIHTTNKVVQASQVEPDVDHPCTTKEEKKQAKDQYLSLKRLYRKLAQRYELSSISFHNKTLLEYNCLEIHLDCKAKSRVPEFLLPPCCLKLKNKSMENYNTFTRDMLIPYVIKSGTLLGAVKFKNPLPWDFDDDVHFENADVSIFKANYERLIQIGFTVSYQIINENSRPNHHEYVYTQTQGGFSFDIWGNRELIGELSKLENKTYVPNIPCLQFGHYPTPIENFYEDSSNITNYIKKQRMQETEDRKRKRANLPKKDKIGRAILRPKSYPPIKEARCYLLSFVRLGENWLPAPFNPGLEALKDFGDNLFKHRPHWRFTPEAKYIWPPCHSPNHPMCLNAYPTDGSIPFL